MEGVGLIRDNVEDEERSGYVLVCVRPVYCTMYRYRSL